MLAAMRFDRNWRGFFARSSKEWKGTWSEWLKADCAGSGLSKSRTGAPFLLKSVHGRRDLSFQP